MSFAPEDEVVCVTVDNLYPHARGWFTVPNELRVNAHYIVQWAGKFTHPNPRIGCYDGVHIVGVDRGDGIPFAASRFRPVRRESIDLFKKMAASATPPVPVEV